METEKKKRYGFVAAPEYPEGGKVKMRTRIAFKVDQLEELKEFVTEKGNVNITITEWREGYPTLSVYDPNEKKTGDLPF
jgi:aminoglycoside N3'-acetyltransferase